jgi:hypothetical protein
MLVTRAVDLNPYEPSQDDSTNLETATGMTLMINEQVSDFAKFVRGYIDGYFITFTATQVAMICGTDLAMESFFSTSTGQAIIAGLSDFAKFVKLGLQNLIGKPLFSKVVLPILRSLAKAWEAVDAGTKIEQLLAKFPDGYLATMVEWFETGQAKIWRWAKATEMMLDKEVLIGIDSTKGAMRYLSKGANELDDMLSTAHGAEAIRIMGKASDTIELTKLTTFADDVAKIGEKFGIESKLMKNIEELAEVKGVENTVRSLVSNNYAEGYQAELSVAAERIGAENIERLGYNINTVKGNTELDVYCTNGDIIEVKSGRYINFEDDLFGIPSKPGKLEKFDLFISGSANPDAKIVIYVKDQATLVQLEEQIAVRLTNGETWLARVSVGIIP